MIGTGYIIEVKVTAPEGAETDFSLGFYVERDFVLSLDKSELVRITTDEGVRLFALVDSSLFGRGHLMCRVEIKDKEPLWNDRPTVFRVFTGISFGNCLCRGGEVTVCSGYEFCFSIVEDIPKDVNARIFYGVIKDWVTGYEFITEEIVEKNGLTVLPVGTVEKTSIDVVAGDRVLVLVPCNEFLTPRKDDGFGGKMPFDVSFMGCNGGLVLRYKDIDYKVYGEFMTVDGVLSFYID